MAYKWIGARFGKLVAIRYAGHSFYECQCDCGGKIVVFTGNLTKENVTRCAECNERHGGCRSDASPEIHAAFTTWRKMRARCTNPNDIEYARYGGRGICVCEPWRNFRQFLADMGPRPEGCVIDRIDPNGNYEPTNCRWSTRQESARNRRPWKHTPEGLARISANLPNRKEK